MITTEFLLTSLVVVLIPGTGVIYTVSNGLFLGWRASIAAAFGCTAGISANAIRHYVVNSPKIITRLQRTFAFIFAGLGAKLALTD